MSLNDLNSDIKEYILGKFAEDDSGPYMFHSFLLLNREWSEIAVKFLYKDTWIFIKRISNEKLRAKQLIDTYLNCLPDSGITTKYDYIEKARNLHIPDLYECVIYWEEETQFEDDQLRGYDQSRIKNIFFKLFRAFIQRSNLKKCTFAKSSLEAPHNPPINDTHLHEIATRLHARNVQLNYLNLGYFPCTDDALLYLTGNITYLKTFKVKMQTCSDQALARFLRTQRALTKLKIRSGDNISETISALSSLSGTLVKLRILDCNLETHKRPFTSIATCTGLRSLYMYGTKFSREVSTSDLLMPIARNCTFHNVDFTGTILPGDVLASIAINSSSTLRRVFVKRPSEQFSQLEDDEFAVGINALADHAKNLTDFACDILPEETTALLNLLNSIGHSLERLEIGSPALISRESSDLIRAIARNCSSLTTLDVSYFSFSKEAFEELIRGTRIQNLDLRKTHSIDDALLKIMKEVWDGTLQCLIISECENVSENAISDLDWVEDVVTDITERRVLDEEI
ncbi:8522_t:CDS:2 [Ambispora gerdemannii]|uniref:8522_t:CDS:1 n=1 Tax=Ambispora gerdemannii TaxID=144530 RepID=A0A9N8VND4_9GLOM|nr:8522_t:CDS:2 [Ambispora gerdemannii]